MDWIEGRGEVTEEVAVAEAMGPLAGGINFPEEKAEGESGECGGGGVCLLAIHAAAVETHCSEERPQ